MLLTISSRRNQGKMGPQVEIKAIFDKYCFCSTCGVCCSQHRFAAAMSYHVSTVFEDSLPMSNS
jgi:hypothetical protein